ncbi:MAG: twin-arginine translocase TatA/TatE family subunit [Sphingomonas sp.]|jgi:sec-independent protein translocase protein TatA|uniref:twin-arginine translocase TatA/TatE family subunit n=1 Tax=unclassified Sphingomonas TaxID=196159 RepID=UPI00053E7F01|nr:MULTISPECIES: twin-arginine translocase TatA/TatE family subunit [unclassified Sphingomonas]MDR6847384.1 sec-independent protein translocase protein TatA [Sphingomonas sp. BE137]RUN76786.1 Sec-independent protein translocase TatA [Sphingomonas sp. TF3]
MGGLSFVHWLIFGGIAILVLGGGRFSNMMGDVAKGIKSFKKGMAEDDEPVREPSRIEAKKAAEPVFDRDGNRIRETEI